MGNLPSDRFVFRFHALLAGTFLLILGATSSGFAGEAWSRIEEDWELRLHQPEPDSGSPQVALYLTPDASRRSTYFQLQLNYADDNHFSGGGFRVSALQSEQAVDHARSEARDLFSTDGEVVRWTNVVAIRDGEILFAIKNGTSQSWGMFGGPEYLVRMPQYDVESLANYNPRLSLEDVDIGFGRNRVDSLVLRRVRVYREDGTSIVVETNWESPQ
jgi:hypothetical protein